MKTNESKAKTKTKMRRTFAKNWNLPHRTLQPAQSRWFLFFRKFIQARRQQTKTKLGVVQRVGQQQEGGEGKILFVHCLGGTASAFGQKFRWLGYKHWCEPFDGDTRQWLSSVCSVFFVCSVCCLFAVFLYPLLSKVKGYYNLVPVEYICKRMSNWYLKIWSQSDH